MPRLAANLSLLFPELRFLDRFAAAHRQGFDAVECLFPYAFDRHDIAARLVDNDLKLVLFNTPPGDFDRGERGLAAIPGREEEFRRGFEAALGLAEAFSCKCLHFMAGVLPANADPAPYRACFIANLAWATALARRQSMLLLLEALNPYDVPNYLLPTIPAALGIMNELRVDNLFLQFDAYHTQMNQGRLAENLREHFDLIRHIQISGVPGRHEPDERQEINYAYLLSLIDELGYDGWVGCEYRPRGATSEGLIWARPWLGRKISNRHSRETPSQP
jgi:2-dehydrotetronate isomerase